MVTLYNEDCLQAFERVGKASVDLVLADPPYGISRESNFCTMGRSGIDFGDWDREFDNAPWIEKAYGALRDGGSLVTFNDFKKASEVIDCARRAGFEYKDTVIWKKTNPMPRNTDRRYVPDIEMIQWFVKPGKWVFNKQSEAYESSVISMASVSEKRVHPTQKPVGLMERLVKIHSNKGDVVLDPFMGSGTTGVAAKHAHRNFIGVEIDENYFGIAQKRIENSEMEWNLFMLLDEAENKEEVL